jgi:hypothetical protein
MFKGLSLQFAIENHLHIKIVNYVYNTKYFNVEAKCKNLLAQQWNFKIVLAQEEFLNNFLKLKVPIISINLLN